MRAAESDAAAVLFPGQGAYDMVALQAANKAYLEVAEVFAEIDKVTLEECDRSLSDVLFRSPSPSVSDLMADEPWVSQLTILGSDLAAYRILDRLGFAPDVFVGHSLGEIAALVCAGGYSTEDGARLVLRRVQALESLDRQDAYMAALSTDPRHAQLAIELIAWDDLIMVTAANHPWAPRKKLTIDDLGTGKWVLREAGSGTRAAFVKALEALGVPYRNLNIAIELPSNEAVLTAVLAGAGATILSARVCAGAIAAGALKRLPVPVAPRAFSAIQHGDRYRSRAVSALLDILRAHATV